MLSYRTIVANIIILESRTGWTLFILTGLTHCLVLGRPLTEQSMVIQF